MPIEKLQKLPDQYRWALAGGVLIDAIARNKPVVRGTHGSNLGLLVRGANRLGLVWLLLALVGALELMKLLVRQRAPSLQEGAHLDVDYPPRFFIGFGAGAEEQLYKQYCREHAGKVARLDQLDVGSFAHWHHVGVKEGWRSLVRTLMVARRAVAALPPELAPWRTEFMTNMGIRCGYYAYMCAWFRRLNDEAGTHLKEVAFLSPDMAAFAAVDAGLTTCFLQHGLIRRSTLLPEFTRIEAMTADESEFMRRCLPRAQVNLYPRTATWINPEQMTGGILVASIYGEPEYIQLIEPFIQWAADQRIPIWVRRHPREDNSFWRESAVARHVQLETEDADFLGVLSRLRPRLVVSWFSTTLADALEYGVIPVSVCSDDDGNVEDMVYPLFQRCLRWPKDADSIMQLLSNDGHYSTVLSRLRQRLSVSPT